MEMLFKHDCDKCIPLGVIKGHDLYFCAQHGCATVVARYGDNGEDYYSGLSNMGVLNIAQVIAIQCGLIEGS